MKNRLIIGLFCCLSLMQIIIPLSMIGERESILKYGQLLKFKTAPIDPYDAFRGKYVALRIEADSMPLPVGMNLNNGQIVYAQIAVDESGFTKLVTLSAKRPTVMPYIRAKVRFISGDKVHLDLPINRYYMEENAAPAAERLYRMHSAVNKQDAYVLVKIKDGAAVVEQLYVGGRRIEEAVKEEIKNKKQ